jgi:hypothetical protein
MKTGADIIEFIRVDGKLVRLKEYRAAHPLTAEQLEANRKGLVEAYA